MIDLEQLRKDMGAGTDGPWLAGHFSDDTHPCNCKYILAEYGGMGSIATIDVCEKMDGPWGDDVGPALPQAQANARRIARLPDLERAYLELREAADQLADAVDNCGQYAGMDLARVNATLAAYRKATQ